MPFSTSRADGKAKIITLRGKVNLGDFGESELDSWRVYTVTGDSLGILRSGGGQESSLSLFPTYPPRLSIWKVTMPREIDSARAM